ncbi:hypothetical protein [Nocardia sp. NPDC046763]|uniref:hypothetical protein n=1 Tax=Nocardia sp. NPDC046763 TaxID=3155256 RepID=UPI0033EC2576
MPRADPLRSPRALGPAGQALWREINTGRTLDGPTALLVTQACRIADICAGLREELDRSPLTVTNDRGDEAPSPLVSETRQQSLALLNILTKLGVGKLPAAAKTTRSALDELADELKERRRAKAARVDDAEDPDGTGG